MSGEVEFENITPTAVWKTAVRSIADRQRDNSERETFDFPTVVASSAVGAPHLPDRTRIWSAPAGNQFWS
jgi:hypothetical protein